MTSNQVSYWANKEKERHNRTQEDIDRKSQDLTKRGQDLTHSASKYSSDKKLEGDIHKANMQFNGQLLRTLGDVIPF